MLLHIFLPSAESISDFDIANYNVINNLSNYGLLLACGVSPRAA